MPIITAVSSPTTALITSTSDASGNISYVTANTTAMVIDTNQNTTHTGYVSAPNTFGYKNRIINGDFRISQYNGNTSVTAVHNTYAIDRFVPFLDASGYFSIGQNLNSLTPPPGFTNYLGVQSTSTYAQSGGNRYGVRMKMEGYSIADLAWGTASAKPVTLSFWAQSSQTGNYGGSIQQGTGGYNYLFSYNITSANTWQFFTIVIPGPTGGGTWTTNSNVGWTLWLDVGSGTSNQGTAYTWGNTGLAPTGSATILSATSTTLYWTGFQLEKGNIATPFDYRDYGNELRMCQRYYQYLGGSTASGDQYLASGMCNTSTQARFSYIFPVPMRTSPSVTFPSVSNFQVYSGAVTTTATAIFNPGVVDYRYMAISATVSSGLTAGYGAILLGENTTSSAIQISAEL